MTTKTFPDITFQKWQDIKTVFAQKTGVAITSDSGHDSFKGIEFSWFYSNNGLTICILSVAFADKMLGYNEQTVMNDFSGWVEGIT